MKKLLTLTLLFLFTITSVYSQITIDHNTSGYLTNTALSRDGNKLFSFNDETRELIILNMDYSQYKTIMVPETGVNYNTVEYVTDSLFNTDSKIEYVLNYYNSTDSLLILNEDGEVLLKSPGGVWGTPEKDFIFGQTTKLIAKSSKGSWVYNIPGKYEQINRDFDSNQHLSYNDGILSISNGNEVDISSINTDEQILSLRNDTLYLSNGGHVFIGEESTSSQVISLNANGLSNIYPNPAFESIQIHYQLPNTVNTGTIELLNNQGVIENKFQVYENNGSISLDVNQYRSGQYYIKLYTTNGYSSIKKALIVK